MPILSWLQDKLQNLGTNHNSLCKSMKTEGLSECKGTRMKSYSTMWRDVRGGMTYTWGICAKQCF